MLNHIWTFILLFGLIAGALFGRLEQMMSAMFTTCRDVVMVIALPLAGMMMLWLGIMRLMEKSGMMQIVAKLLSPLLKRLFPEVPEHHPAMGAITMNLAANMLGLGNSATPLGLKAMQHLQDLNPHKTSASNAMCMFLALNTAGFALLPVMGINYLASAGVTSPYAIIVPALIVTFLGSVVAIFAAKFLEKRPGYAIASQVVEKSERVNHPLLQRKIWLILAAILFVFGLILQVHIPWRDGFLQATGLQTLLLQAEEAKNSVAAKPLAAKDLEVQQAAQSWRQTVGLMSMVAIPLILFLTVAVAYAKRVAVYEEMVEGAKEGFDVALRIMPFLVVMLSALAIFRESGALLLIEYTLAPILHWVGMPTELLPLAIMRPLSGSGSAGLLNELLMQPNLSEAIKYTAGILYGSSETTFYVLAVYFGSVGIKHIRHSLAAGLIADLAGTIAAVSIGRIVFGF